MHSSASDLPSILGRLMERGGAFATFAGSAAAFGIV